MSDSELCDALRGDAADSVLLQAFCSGDQTAFAAIHQRYAPELRGYVKRRLGHVVEDIVQEVFLVLAQRAHRVDPLRGFLYKIARDKIADWQRKEVLQARFTQTEQSEPAYEADDAEETLREVAKDLDKWLPRLTERERVALQAIYFDELSPQEASAKLGIAQVTLRKQVSRAIVRLRAILAIS